MIFIVKAILMLIFPFYKTSLSPPSINGNMIYEVYSKGSVIHTEKLNLKNGCKKNDKGGNMTLIAMLIQEC